MMQHVNQKQFPLQYSRRSLERENHSADQFTRFRDLEVIIRSQMSLQTLFLTQIIVSFTM